MVRSKFPGKPSKFNNRKLVKVSNFVAATNQENESAIAPELYICFGLSVFNNAFERKDNNSEKDEGAPFHGFSPEEIAATKKEAILRIAEIEKEYKNRGAAFLPLDKKLGSKSLILPESFVGKDDDDRKNSGTVSVVNKEIDRSARCNNIDGDTPPQCKRKKQKTSDCDSKPLKKSSSNNCKSNNKNSGAGLSKVECGGATTIGNYLSREKSIVNGSPNVTSAFYSRKNFVLPSHSGYSSRVIKPNKRFLADGTRKDGAESTVGSSSGSNSCNSSIASGCDFSDPIDSSVNEQTSSSTTSSVTAGTGGGGIKLKKSRLVLAHTDPNITWAKSRDDKTNIVSDVESETSSLKSCCSSSVTSGSSNNSRKMSRPPPPKKKIILRKSRLNVDSVHDLLRLRPPLNTVCLATGKIICGVCGSTRYYRFVKQARKFGIYCCEPCRKFISKCIHACSSLKALKCIEGRGNCTVPPVLKTVVWDTTRKMMNGKKGKVRCQACWLKLCIRRFCMPDYLNYRLNQMLPPFMKDPFLVAPTSKFTLSTSRRTTGRKMDGGAKGKTGAGGSVPKEEKVGADGKERARETINRKKRRRSQLNEREKLISLRQARLQERLRRKQLGRNARKGDEVNRNLRSSSTSANTNRMRKRSGGGGGDVVRRATTSSSSNNKKRNAVDDVSQDDDDEENEDCDVGGHNDDNNDDDDEEDDDNDDDSNKKTKVRANKVDVKQEEESGSSSSSESDDRSSTGSSGGGDGGGGGGGGDGTGTGSNGGKCDEESEEGNHKRRKLLSAAADHGTTTTSKGKFNLPSTSCSDASKNSAGADDTTCGSTQIAEKKCSKRRNNVKSRRQFVNDRKSMESRNEKQLKHRQQRRKRRRRRNRRNREKGSSDELEHDDESNMTAAASSATDGFRRTVEHKSQPLVPPSSSGGRAQQPISETNVPVTKVTEPPSTEKKSTGNTCMVPPSSGPIEVKKRRRRKADDILLIGIIRDEIRQKRKAALNSLANIARVTGRITESPVVVENQLIVARNLKKRAAAIARRDTTTCAISAVPNSKKLTDGVGGGIKRKRNQPLNEGAAGFCRRTKLTAVVGDAVVTTNSSRGRNTAGPRVKHVCRSASLVLGRQVATFSNNNGGGGTTKSMSMDLKELPALGESLSSSSSPCDRSNAVGVDYGSTGAVSCSQFVDGNIGNSRSCCGEPSSSPLPPPLLPPPAPSANNNSLATSGRIRQPSSGGGATTTDAFTTGNRRIDEDSSVDTPDKIKPKIYARNLQDLGRQNCELLDGIVRQSEDTSVSIDFWESYDPDEVCKTGFALIGYDPSITVQSLCYLCGSAGEDQLIHCACCCEPYHLFCVEGGLKEKKRPLDSWWRVDWVCPRCAICTACGQGDGHQVNCNRCHKSYHSDCMPHHKIANRVHSADRPLVCHSCLRCKSCNGESVSVFVGNMSLCTKCFKRRQDGNYCPICQKSYDANDYNTFMMECGRCKCWIHSDCERLLDEQYHVLSTLPDTVEFICRLCCDSDRPPWRLAVDSELNNKYLQVIKSLTKNRKVCELLKCSPKKQQPSLMCTCSNKLAIVNSPATRNVTDQIVSLSNQNVELLTTQNVGQCSSGRVQEMLSVIGRNKNLNDTTSSSSLLFSFLLSSSTSPSLSSSPLETTEDVKNDVSCLSTTIKNNSFLSFMKKEMKPNKLNLVNVSSSNSSSNSSSSTNERDNKIDEAPSQNPSEELHIKLSDQDQPLLSAIQPYQNLVEGKPAQFSPHTSQSDSGIGSTDDELKPPLSNSDNEISSVIAPVTMMKDLSSVKCSLCSCRRSELIMKSPPQLLIDIKNKINGNKYLSLQDFHRDTQKVIELIDDKKLFDIYYQILNGAFPWFDPVDSEVTASADEDFNMSFDSNTIGDVGKFDISDHSEATLLADGKREEKSMVVTSVLKDQLGKSRSYYYCTINFHDTRVCVLCKMIGDCCLEDQGRLLYCGHNEWIHANCALWSNEVFEEIDGSLQRVHSAISRSRLIRCAKCNKRGASVGCCYRNCPESFHFLCAKDADCVFMEDKSIYCYAHQNESKSKPLNEESDFAIMRPIYVELIELEKKKKKSNIPHQQIRIMIGSLMIESLGEFVADISDQEVSIIPCEFVCTRLYWSYKEPWRLMRYRIRTKILQVAQDYFIEEEDNKTVDHSQDIKSELTTCDDDLKMDSRNLNFPVDSVDIKRVLTNLLDSVCDSGNSKSVASDISPNEPIREIDEEEEVEDDKVDEIFGNFTDPQNPVDVLLPELLEGICEAVKHDIVGMSVEDDVINPIMNDGDFCDDGDTTTVTSVHSKSGGGNTTVPFKPLSGGGNKTESKSKDEVKNNSDSNVDNAFKLNTSLKTDCASNTTDSNEKPKAVVKPDIINKRILPTNNKVDCNFGAGDGIEKVKYYDDQNSRILQLDGALDCSSSDSSSDIGSPGCRTSDSEVVNKSSACNSVLLVTIKDTMKDDCSSKFENAKEEKLPKKADVDLIQVDGCADNISDLDDGIDCTGGTSNTPVINDWSDETNDFVIVDEDYENDFVLVNEDHQEDVEYHSDKETVCDNMNCYFYYYTSPDKNEMTDYDGAEWKHIPQVDGISDCISVNSNENSTNNKDKDETEDEDQPVKCLRCHRTYRTAISYERHLSTCNTDYMLSCSESDSSEEEKASSPLNDFASSSSPAASNCDSINNTGETTESATHSNNEANQSSPSSMISSSSSTLSAESNVADGLMIPSATITTTPLVEPNSDFCQGAEDVVEYVVQTSESMDGVQESTCINSALYKEDVEVPVNPDNNSYALAISTSNDQGEIEIPGDVTVVYAPDNIDNCILINVDNNSKMMKDSSASDLTYYITNVDDNSGQCTVIGNHNEKSVCAFIDTSRPKERKISDHQMATTAAIQQQSVVDYSQQTPTLIIQQLPSQQNVIPTYVDAYQQPATVHAQQNVQYIAIDSSDKTGQQYQTVLPNTYQIQTSSPSVQTVVPTVVGTLIQPNGVEQLVLNTAPSNPIDVFTHQPAAAYISSPPPLYMNMETVVSNTVMSSSQFVSVPGSVPGMLSTYSATTTQVFQAAAAKPVIPEVPAQSYIVINTAPATETANTTSSGIIDNGSVHHINILPQTIATANQNHLLQSQENNQWRLTSPVVHQQPTQKQPQHQSIYKYNDKTCTGVHQVIHPNKNHERLQQTPNEPRIKTELINSCKNNSLQRNDDQLKIQQNAKKIDPVHGLSKMVENIQSAVSTNKKICLNNYPVKHKPPEAKVIPLQKANNQIFSVDQFKEKITTKKIINSFDLNKPNCYYNNKLLSNKPTDDSLKKPNAMNCATVERSKVYKNYDYDKNELNLPDDLKCSRDVISNFLNRVSSDKPDRRKVIVQPIPSNNVQESRPIDCVIDEKSDSAAVIVTTNENSKMRTYTNSKRKLSTISQLSQILSPQRLEEIKLQLLKESNKNSQRANSNLTNACSSLSSSTATVKSTTVTNVTTTAGTTCTSTNSTWYRNSIPDSYNTQVLQPTLKENKLHDKMKSSVPEKSVENNFKRIKSADKKVPDNLLAIRKRDLLKPSSEMVEKVKNSSKPQKIDKLKRKDNNSSSTMSNENLIRKLIMDSIKSSKDPLLTSNKSLISSGASANMIFQIESNEGEIVSSAENLVDAWQQLFEKVQKEKASQNLPLIPRNPYQCEKDAVLKILGLGHNSVKYVMEQLPGVGSTVKYRPTYHKNRHQFIRKSQEMKENQTGCARSEPYTARNKYDMFSWLASRHRRPPKFLETSDADMVNGNRRATSLNLPMAMRFRHLRETSKEAVGVFRSDIHGRGLFCLRDIDSGEMVIEYAGEVIRSALTDKREKYYTSKGIGCYMFRIDDNFVVDATMKGNAARFINHSCEPNCYSRVVDILGKKHILIFALRRIPQGEELTYDYKFPLEDDKITCHCLSRKCRKYLN